MHQDLVEYRTHYRWAVILVLGIFLILGARLFKIQVVDGEHYEALATISHVVRERIVPARGTIRDRNGAILATDVEVADLMVVPKYVRDLEGEVSRLVELGVLGQDEAAGVTDLVLAARQDRRRFHKLVAKRSLVGNRCPHDLTNMAFDAREGQLVCPRCGRHFVDQKAVAQSHLHDLPGFSLRARMMRHYPVRDRTIHAVGYVNEVTRAEVDSSEGRFRPGDLIGRSGIERALDDVLRGLPGEDVYVRRAGGRRVDPGELPEPFRDLKSTPPVAGRDVTLSLDMGLQQVAATALAPHNSGALVVLDVVTGEVLALVSEPTFVMGPRVRADKLDATPPFERDFSPMLNKATTAFPPASTFKIVTALAAMMEGAASDETEINCPGHLDYKGRRFHCFRRSGHGPMKLVAALAASCDTYFYVLADILGLDTLAHYARDWFGLGEKTGIEIPEQSGVMPTEAWYQSQRRRYQPGFAINSSVGQGDVRVSPLALARAYASLVNGGNLHRLRLVKAIQDPGQGTPTETSPEVVRTLDLPDEFIDIVKAGLHGAVNSSEGTAFGVMMPELPFAGKTGTAQASERRKGASPELASWLLRDHAWFAAYAPAKRPRIVVVAFIEHGGFGGAVAAPVARKVIDAWYTEHAEDFADLWEGMRDVNVLEVMEAP